MGDHTYVSNSYANRVIFYMNACFAVIVGAGVMAQFVSGKDSVTCRTDGTRRIAEPGSGENFHCVMVFVLIYYFAIACCVWAVVLVYTWSLIFHRLGKISANDDEGLARFEKRVSYFHLLAWSLPLILTIAAIFLNAIDGDPLTGVCFISHHVRTGPGQGGGVSLDGSLVGWFLILPLRSLVTSLFKVLFFSGNVSVQEQDMDKHFFFIFVLVPLL